MVKAEHVGGRLGDVRGFIGGLYGPDLHAKRVDALAGATLGVMAGASLAVAMIGQALAQARGLVTKHAVKQVDRLMSNGGIDVWDSFARWVPQQVGAQRDILVAMDWTDFDHDGQSTLVLSLVTGHGRAAPLIWLTVWKEEIATRAQRLRGRLPAPPGRDDAARLRGHDPGRPRLRRPEAVRVSRRVGVRLRHPLPRQHPRHRRER
jgi:hypothetical protein